MCFSVRSLVTTPRMIARGCVTSTMPGKLEEAQPYFVEELKYMPSVHRGIQPCMERAKSLYLVGRADEACLLYEWAFHRWANAEESGELYTNLGVCALR